MNNVLTKNLAELKQIQQKDIIPCKIQPRNYYDPKKLHDLTVAIMQQGFNSFKPLVVTKNSEGKYNLVGGYRRYFGVTWALEYLRKEYYIANGQIVDPTNTFRDWENDPETVETQITNRDWEFFPLFSEELPCFIVEEEQAENIDLIAFLDNKGYSPMTDLDTGLFLHKQYITQYLPEAKEYIDNAKAKKRGATGKLTKYLESAKVPKGKGYSKDDSVYSLCKTIPSKLAKYKMMADFGYKSDSILDRYFNFATIPSDYHLDINRGTFHKIVVDRIAQKLANADIDLDSDRIERFCKKAFLVGCKISESNNNKGKVIQVKTYTVGQLEAQVDSIFATIFNAGKINDTYFVKLPDKIANDTNIDYYNQFGVNAIAKVLSDNEGKYDRKQLEEFAIDALQDTFEIKDNEITHREADNHEMTKVITHRFKEFVKNNNLTEKVDPEIAEREKAKQDKIDKVIKSSAETRTKLITLNSLVNPQFLETLDGENAKKLYNYISDVINNAKSIKSKIEKNYPTDFSKS